ncbi:MAG: hypothetical protein AAFO29_03980, partial [Actinomycetota bacterium]
GLVPIRSRFRSIVAEQVPTHFDPELASTTPARRADLIATIDSMTSIEAFLILQDTHQRSETQVRRSWLAAIDAILAPT